MTRITNAYPAVEHRPCLGPSDGEHSGWEVVCAGRDSVTTMTMCVCGADDCYWTATVYLPNFVHTAGKELQPIT